MLTDVEFWKQWEGEVVEPAFPLERYAGGSSRGAVFETQFEGRPAAVKMVTGTPESIGALLALWKKSAGLAHPALVKILASGETALGVTHCAYIVMERAEENLAEVLAERSLTAAETREMLIPLLDVLQYLHANGFAHGGLKPSNIMAFGDQLKIAGDSLVPGGDPAADCRGVGALLKEVLGVDDRNALLPEPFAGIAMHTLTADPAARWNLAQIGGYLRGDPPPSVSAKSRGIWWGLAAAVAVILGLIAFWPPKDNDSIKPATPPEEKKGAGASRQPKVSPSPKETPLGPPTPAAKPPAKTRPATVGGITQVLPEIPQSARNTISGRIRIHVRVRVDNAGNVSQATPELPPASKYLTGRVLAAARAWKFPPGNAPQDWALRFELTRDNIQVSSTRIAN